MDKLDLKEALHEEVNEPLNQIAKNTTKGKKKIDYKLIIVWAVIGGYLIYMLYDLTKSIH